MTWLMASWHKIIIGLLALDRLWDRGVILYEKITRAEQFFERRIHERRQTMINPLSILNDVAVAAKAIEKLKGAMPLIAKLVADAKQASADKNDQVKLYADIEVLLADIDADLTLLAGLFPPPAAIPEKPAA